MQTRPRDPLIWTGLIALAVALGLGSRRFGHCLPGWVAAFTGDTLWAFVAYSAIALALPSASKWRVAASAMAFSAAVEVSQLYHAPWIDSIRRTTPGGLILGQGFLGSDLACYAVGVGLGVMIEVTLPCRIGSRTSSPGTSSTRSKG